VRLGRLALEFLILTAARVGEVRGAAWREIDAEGRLWTIPAERMKAGIEHRVPLSDRALAILDHVRPLNLLGLPVTSFRMTSAKKGEHSLPTLGFVFPGLRPGKPISASTIRLAMGRDDITAHGFRSSFRDWAADRTDFPREICEAALAHVTGNEVERSYRRGDALEKRRALMEQWAAFCTGNYSQ
jgi:integrase